MKNTFFFALIFILAFANAQERADWVYNYPDGCTSITVGKKATFDGSVVTSHTDDSHRTQSEMNIVQAKDHAAGSVCPMYKRENDNTQAMPAYKNVQVGEIPQVSHTNKFLNTAYPSMNEKQLGIGESTFGGRDELKSDKGLIDCQRLCQLMLERCSTAREAIKMADELTKKYGWNDAGECLTIADKNEVWHFEIVGPGKDKVGAVWVAQRVPDDHLSVNANASTIKEIDLKNKDFFMASANIYEVAKANGWWSPEKGTFSFCHVYAPESRESVASRRREWRVFDLVAPSLKLDPNDKDYPFSVKPDSLVTMEKLISIFKDYYEGTPYDMRNNILSKDENGKAVISPLANPFMPYDQLPLHNVSGGWYHVDEKTKEIDFLGERTIARWYTMYGTIIQCRSWLPDEVGGIVWLAQDNIANSIYIPVYCGTDDLPDSYEYPGRLYGYTTKSAWWAFNRLGTLAAQRWGDMKKDLDAVWLPWQKEILTKQKEIDAKATELLKKSNSEGKVFLTKHSMEWGEKVVAKAWELGDFLWTKYDEKF
ncbi:MAG: peptidase C69 [Bacteroidetes bacterium GWF2_38_335]|nr:MAG: peptidase C69 [Bacteroidetes bacterium GWF2_38_335]OFY78766.1 MAG: peptidase C69 [Bacteroidetes bacterium RIFOXYA12_FULL_38_20]HBS85158.1 peptidase C69 [Bacteroidales bacterium]